MSVSENSTTLPRLSEHNGTRRETNGRTSGLEGLAVYSYEKSPYTDPDLVCLEVGPKQTPFRVHRIILCQSPELKVEPFSKLWGDKSKETIALPDLDVHTAHILVHYLYSGRYQTLKTNGEDRSGAISAYKLGTCVYCAAVKYKLPGLSDLAKEKIESFGEELTIWEILRVAREHAFPLLPEDESWFPEYLEGAIHLAAKKDPGLFMKPEFSDQLEGHKGYRQVVVKAMVNSVNSYSRGPAVSGERQTGLSTPVTEPRYQNHPPSIVSEPLAEVSEQEPAGALTAVAEEVGNETIPSETPIGTVEGAIEELKLDDIEPTPQVTEAPEPYADELGYGTSKTYQKFGKKVETPAENKVPKADEAPVEEKASKKSKASKKTKTPVEEPTVKEAETPAEETKAPQIPTPQPPTHKRVDSAIQSPDTVVPEEVIVDEKKAEVAPAVEEKPVVEPAAESKENIVASPNADAPLIVDGTTNGAAPASKKSKKNKKKKNAAAGTPTTPVA